jgi:hypothetical protein
MEEDVENEFDELKSIGWIEERSKSSSGMNG